MEGILYTLSRRIWNIGIEFGHLHIIVAINKAEYNFYTWWMCSRSNTVAHSQRSRDRRLYGWGNTEKFFFFFFWHFLEIFSEIAKKFFFSFMISGNFNVILFFFFLVLAWKFRSHQFVIQLPLGKVKISKTVWPGETKNIVVCLNRSKAVDWLSLIRVDVLLAQISARLICT